MPKPSKVRSGTPAKARDLAVARPSGLADNVYDILLGQLMSLDIKPGERLTVDNLSRELGVSQTPVREALGRLEANGLVVKTHLVGYRAAPQLTKRQFEDLFEFRLLLEPFSAERFAEILDKEKAAKLKSIVQAMKGPGRVSHYREFAVLDSEFHDYIAAMGGNDLIRESLARLHTHIHIFRLYSHARVTQEAIDEHRVILDAVLAGDGKQASRAMKAHIEKSRKRILSVFD